MIQYETKNWRKIVLTFHGTVLPRVLPRVLLCGAIGVALSSLQYLGIARLAIPGVVHTLVGLALGLLLVFRTNASYDRYWEGRRLVGHINNNCRDLARQLASFLAESPAEVRRCQGGYIMALYAAIRRYLRGERQWPELAAVLREDELAQLGAVRAPPLLVARWLLDGVCAEVRAGRMSEIRLQIIDAAVSDVVDAWGGCERILRTPVPFTYAHHIKGFLTIFCMTVPLALLESMGWYTGLASAVVAYALFGIDEIGVEIEDPFGYDPNDLPLDTIGENLAIDVRQVLGLA